ncbi:GH1 family beta-glucosidase [Rubrolithibacter danxiaensis]|uniref:GH1 family beta-glucosidase n=1 Tax=Rubrolithibacter danxiaensis TaxID=3390805 RepID=UPI003BF84D7A
MSDLSYEEFNKSNFGRNFHWGVSVAASQIEGAHNTDGKGPSIWDEFASKKGKILNGDHACIACDFYNQYKKDIQLIKSLNIPNFRFSISWPRIFPEGIGSVNQAGIDFYNRVIDYCLASGITPWITLYHWDLPKALELKGGWTNRDIISWFSNYVNVCAASFGDRVKNWMIMNEPMVFTGAGYFLGIHAPGRTGLKNFIPAIHHVALSMAEGGRMLKELLPSDTTIGSTFSCSHIEPHSKSSRDYNAAVRVDALLNRLSIEPALGLGYPFKELPFLKRIEKYMHPGDEQKIKFDLDFVGIQNYTREIIKHSFFTPYLQAKLIKAEKRKVPLTAMGWEVYPPAMYHVLKKISSYKAIKRIIITENGAAFPDTVVKNTIDDPLRIDFLKKNLQQVLRAKQEGCPVEGYFVWTLTDNFEWAEGYKPRFGLIYVDFETQKRTVKNSGLWYSEFLKEKD